MVVECFMIPDLNLSLSRRLGFYLTPFDSIAIELIELSRTCLDLLQAKKRENCAHCTHPYTHTFAHLESVREREAERKRGRC